ncbi:hypothetical protein ACN4EG_27630 [Alkalinema pantanalense CENA528]
MTKNFVLLRRSLAQSELKVRLPNAKGILEAVTIASFSSANPEL